MDVKETLDIYINEILKKVIRAGKVKRKTICPMFGMKAQDGKCVQMGAQERKLRKKAAIKRGKMLSVNIGVQKKAAKKRAKSMRKRAMGIPDHGAPSMKVTGVKETRLIDKYLGEEKPYDSDMKGKNIFPKTQKLPNAVKKTNDPYQDFFNAMSINGSAKQNIEYKLGEFATVSHQGKYIEVKKFNKDKTQYTPTRLYPNGKVVKGETVGTYKLK